MANNSFFNRAPAINDKKQTTAKFKLIKVGGKPFHALAVALIDNFKGSVRLPEPTIKRILERFYTHFPQYILQQPYLTSTERMKLLIDSARKSEVVECMAYVLRQITVDAVYAEPVKYREVFEGLDADTPKDFLRHPDRNIPSCALAALASSLGITITLLHTEQGKILHKREVYSYDLPPMPKIELVLRVEDDNFFPRVMHEKDFAYVGQSAIKPPEPIVNAEKNIGTVFEFGKQIAEDNKRLLRIYTQWRQNLLTMVQLNELTKDSLISLYIKFLPSKNSMLSDPARFFSKLTDAKGAVVDRDDSGNSQYVIEELASSLAQWISTNQVDPDSLMDHIDNPSIRSISA